MISSLTSSPTVPVAAGQAQPGCSHKLTGFWACLFVLLCLWPATEAFGQEIIPPEYPPLFLEESAVKQPVALGVYLYSRPDPGDQDASKRLPLLVLWLEPAAGYYAYAHIPQPVSKPTSLTISRPDGADAPAGTKTLYPPGREAPDILDEAKVKLLYNTATPLFIELPADAAGTSLDFKLSMLLCSEAHCLPVTKRFSLAIPALLPGTPKAESQDFWPLYEALRTAGNGRGGKDGKDAAALAGLLGNPANPDGTAHTDYLQNPEILSSTETDPGAAEVSSWEITPRSALPGLEVESLGMAILFGLLAGFILNFMPCMLPVIGLKLTAFMAAGGVKQNTAAIHSFRSYWLYFSGGVICWYVTLAILAATLNIIWGQTFQNSLLVLGMILVVFSLALSTFGFYTLPIISLRGNSSSPHQSFITGFLLTCLTTPCSGPLLGGVLAWTFRQGPEVSSIVLLTVGLGMVTPYLFLAAFPQLSRYCPRPGRWLVRLEILVGFFLLLTTAYLLSMLSDALRPWALGMLAVVTLIAVAVHHFRKYRQETHWKAFALSIFYLVALGVAWRTLVQPADAVESNWMPFTVAEFKENWGRRPIIMDFTADWCANCKVLENTVLTKDKLLDWAERYDAVFMRADLTHDNPAAQAMLQALDSASIPVVALFPANDQAASPVVLRDLFTSQQIETAVRKTFR